MTKPRNKDATRRWRSPNLPFLIGSLVVAVLLAAAAFFGHQYQLKRIAGALLQRATILEEEQEYSKAADYLHRYLRLYPEDRQVRMQLAQTYDQSAATVAQKARAVELYYRALGYAPDNMQLRERLVELLLELQRLPAAEQQAALLLNEDPESRIGLRASAAVAYARARAGQGVPWNQPLDLLQQVLEGHPEDKLAVEMFVEIYREHLREPDAAQRGQIADAAMDRMVAAAGADVQALLMRHRYRLRYGLPGADQDLREALALKENHPEVLLAATDAALHAGKAQQAVSYCEQVIRLAPRAAPGYVRLGEAHRALKQEDQAIKAWRQGLRLADQRDPALNLLLADALIGQAKIQEAGDVLDVLERIAFEPLPEDSFSQQQQALRPAVDLLRARWLVTSGAPWKAIGIAKRAVVGAQASSHLQHGPHVQYEALVLLGDIHAAEQQWDLAAQAYQQATRLPSATPHVYISAARAWLIVGRVHDALRACQQASRQAEVPVEVQMLTAEIRWRQYQQDPNSVTERDLEAALNQALQTANGWRAALLRASLYAEQDQPNRSVAVLRQLESQFPNVTELWQQLARRYEELGQSEDADRALHRLRQLAGDDASHQALHAQFLLRRGHADQARELLLGAVERADADARSTVLIALGELEWRAGRNDQARDYYLQAIQDRPRLRVLQQLAELAIQREDLADAQHWEEQLQQMEGSDGSWWRLYRARRLLEQASSTTDPHFAQAVDLQRDLLGRRPSWPPARILSGMVLEFQGAPQDALAAYEEAIALGARETSVFERMMHLLYQQQDYAQAAHYLELVADRSPDKSVRPAVVAPYVEHLLALGQLEEAQPWIEIVERQDQHSLLWLNLKVRALHAEGQHEQIVPLVESVAQQYRQRVEKESALLQLLLEIAQLYAAVDQLEAAERWYRELYATSPKHYLPLALWLAAHDRGSEALQLCLTALDQEVTPQAALALTQILLLTDPGSSEAYEQADNWLGLLQNEYPAHVELLFATGNVRLKQHRWQEGVTLLQRVTELDPQHYLAWNNLAAVLAEQEGGDSRALAYIDQAIRLGGELPALLDTKATVLLHLGAVSEAVALLERVVLLPDGHDPRFFLHLAVGYHQQGAVEKSRAALQEAYRLGIEAHYLTSNEIEWLADLRRRLLQEVSVDR